MITTKQESSQPPGSCPCFAPPWNLHVPKIGAALFLPGARHDDDHGDDNRDGGCDGDDDGDL